MAIRHFVRRLLGLSMLLSSSIASAQIAPVLQPPGTFDENKVPIYKSRIFVVPEEIRVEALRLLQDSNYVPIDSHHLRTLFPKLDFDTKQMLISQASAADAYADWREGAAEDPFFASSRQWMMQEVEAHRNYAKYTRAITVDLRPYLVNTQVYYEGTGGYYVTLGGGHLSVLHGSLGHSTPQPHAVPIVVFLERKIDSVSLNTAIAQ